GGAAETTNLDIATTLCDLLEERRPKRGGGRYRDQITFVADRPGHDLHYAVDFAATFERLGWTPAVPLPEGLARTVDWYLEHLERLLPPAKLGRIGLMA